MFAKVFISLALVCAFFGTLNAIDVYVDPQQCAEICPVYYNPVCATDGQYYKEFSNDCELRAHNCQVQRSLMRGYVATDLDMCRTELVNGLDELMVKMGNLNMNKPECAKICNKMYEPVCLSNGKYRALASNPCFMNIINCVVGTQNMFRIVRKDTC